MEQCNLKMRVLGSVEKNIAFALPQGNTKKIVFGSDTNTNKKETKENFFFCLVFLALSKT